MAEDEVGWLVVFAIQYLIVIRYLSRYIYKQVFSVKESCITKHLNLFQSRYGVVSNGRLVSRHASKEVGKQASKQLSRQVREDTVKVNRAVSYPVPYR